MPLKKTLYRCAKANDFEPLDRQQKHGLKIRTTFVESSRPDEVSLLPLRSFYSIIYVQPAR